MQSVPLHVRVMFEKRWSTRVGQISYQEKLCEPVLHRLQVERHHPLSPFQNPRPPDERAAVFAGTGCVASGHAALSPNISTCSGAAL